MRKSLVGLLISFIFYTGSLLPAIAQPMYITDEIEVTFRKGPGQDYKIESLLKSGQPVELIEKGVNWSKVGLPNGKTGYVITRYLTSNKPGKIINQALQSELDSLKDQTDESLRREKSNLEVTVSDLSEKLSDTEKSMAALKKEYESLRENSGNVLQLTAQYDEAKKENERYQNEIASLQTDLKKINRTRSIFWFLAGAGVFLGGILIGRIFGGRRRRPGLLV